LLAVERRHRLATFLIMRPPSRLASAGHWFLLIAIGRCRGAASRG
jgi:hypothetical protein